MVCILLVLCHRLSLWQKQTPHRVLGVLTGSIRGRIVRGRLIAFYVYTRC